MKKEELSNYAKGMNCSADVFDWIEKRVPEKYDLSEVEHILDYLASSRRPKRLERATYDQMKSNAAKWVKSLSKKGSKINEGENGVETVLDFGDGFRFVKLISEESYKREGSLMRHCVASYYGRDVEIFSLRDRNNNPHCTIEKDQQIKGKGNGDISPKYIDYVVRFLEWSGMKVRDSEMKNLGYEVVSFAEYIIGGNLYRERYIRKEEEVTYNEDVVIFDDLLEAIAYRGDKICLFKGYAYFEGSSITDLGQLASIGGYADFRNSSITDLGQLASIGGYAYFGDLYELEREWEARK
ncbi:MAG: PcfJ domain-containing protein [Spirochaetales bacterium]|nr:PcfJ domain-containing protein [Spirochaetales bacterium]